jgi:hypothetical protein
MGGDDEITQKATVRFLFDRRGGLVGDAHFLFACPKMTTGYGNCHREKGAGRPMSGDGTKYDHQREVG